MDDKEKKHKLKELERTLAEELDPPLQTPASKVPPLDVALPPKATIDPGGVVASATNAAATGTVTATSSAATGTSGTVLTPPVGTGDAAAQIPTISIDEFDALLRENDPEFDKQMKEMGEGIKKDIAGLTLEKLNIDDLIKDEEEEGAPPPKKEEAPPPLVPRSRFFGKIADIGKALIIYPWSIVKGVREIGVKASVQAFKIALPKIIEKIKGEVREVLAEARLGWQNFKKTSRNARVTMFGLLITGILFLYFSKLLLTGHGVSIPDAPEYMSSFEPVA